MNHAFICHSSHDYSIALKIVDILEKNGINCWIAPRNIKYGTVYPVAIVQGIRQSAMVIFIFTARSNDSEDVINEIENAKSFGKPVITFKMEDIEYSDGLRYYLRSKQSITAFDKQLDSAVNDLIRDINDKSEIRKVNETSEIKEAGSENRTGKEEEKNSAPEPVLEKPTEQEIKISLREQNLWNVTLKSHTIALYKKYLESYPDGNFVQQAKDEIKVIQGGTFINWSIGITIAVFIIFIICISPGDKQTHENVSDVSDSIAPADFYAADTAASVMAVSLLSVADGTIIPEDSLKNYLDYGELKKVKDDEGDEFDYKGGILNGKPHGYGSVKYKNGIKYTGNYKNGFRDGKGTLTWENGENYTGEFKNDFITGSGIYNWPNGNKYIGNLIENTKNGKGTFTWKDGSSYTGEFKNDKKSGLGTYKWSGGDKYIGSYIEDEMNGYGEYYSLDSIDITECIGCKVYKGNWKNDKKNGNGKCYDKNGKLIYDGPFKDDKPLNKYPSN